MTWQAIWNEGKAVKAPPVTCDTPLRSMTLWLEVSGPRHPGTVRSAKRANRVPLRLWRGASPDPGAAISVFLMPDHAVRLVHGEIDLCSDPDMMRPGEVVGLRYVTCRDGRQDGLEITNFDQGRSQVLRSGMAHAASLAEAFPAADGYLKVAHIAAVAPNIVPATDLPGIEAGSVVATAQGPRPVDALRPGDLLLDDEGQGHPLRWIEARARLCMGRTAPMRLRAPYFGLARDLIVTPQTRLLQSGPVVDYLCGTDAVLAQVGDLANGRAVFRDRQKPVRHFYHLMLDDPTCILVEDCPIETAHLGDVMALGDPQLGPAAAPSARDLSPSLPLLDRPTARALMTAYSRAA